VRKLNKLVHKLNKVVGKLNKLVRKLNKVVRKLNKLVRITIRFVVSSKLLDLTKTLLDELPLLTYLKNAIQLSTPYIAVIIARHVLERR
jgi:ABC-type transporter Mla subunit MlaD